MPPGVPSSRPLSPEPTERLFIALTLPAPVRETLAALAEPIDGFTWTQPEQLHVTLRFLGEVPEAKASAMIARLAAVHVAAFVLPIEGVGSFPPGRPARVLWVGTGSGHPRLFQLRQRIDDAVLAAGIDADLRTFHPHVTLARTAPSAARAVEHWVHAHREFAAAAFRVEAFDLYSSALRPAGAIHTLKQRFPLDC